MANILILIDLPNEIKARLEALLPAGSFTYAADRQPTGAEVAAAQVIVGSLPAGMLGQATNLKWMQIPFAGTDSFHREGTKWPAGAVLTCASGAYGTTVSEHMAAMTLALMKKLSLYRDNQNQSTWRGEGPAVTVHGSRTCVIGLGDIGGAYARIMQAMGSRVTGVRRASAGKPDYVERLAYARELPEVVRDADIIALALPVTRETTRILSRELIFSLKPGAIVVNAGRGSAIDTEALCDALEQGRLLAGLDVTDPEPLPPEHRLWRMPGAIITPHVSGGLVLEVTKNRFYDILLDNFAAFVSGGPMRGVVDFERGY